MADCVELLTQRNGRVGQAPVLAWVISCIVSLCAFVWKGPPFYQLMSIASLNFQFKAPNLCALGNFPRLVQPDRSLIYFASPEPLWTQFVFFNFVLVVTWLFISFFSADVFYIFFSSIFYLFIFRERSKEGERGRETLMCERYIELLPLSHTTNWEPGPQPRHVPWLGMELATFWFTGRHSIHWATPARVAFHFMTVCCLPNYSINSAINQKWLLSFYCWECTLKLRTVKNDHKP